MKVLSLTQPYATLVAIGAKHIETRSWATTYRGPLAIHAAKGLGPVGGETGLAQLCACEPFLSALATPMVGRGMIKPSQLPRGVIIAVVELVDVVTIIGNWQYEAHGFKVIPDEPERSFGNYSGGRWAWLLRNVRRLREPIPARGSLGLWEYDTAAIMAALEEPHA